MQFVHCYAEGQPGKWEAVCLDFDLAVQGGSFEEVYGSLSRSIDLYVEYVSTLPRKERAAFLARRAPLSLRLRFLWYAFRDLLSYGGAGGKQRAEYTATCPVCPA